MLDTVYQDTMQALEELQREANLGSRHLVVIGASSSEVVGKRIGTAGSLNVANAIVSAVLTVRQQFGFQVAFQCCEHLNRALVIPLETAERFGYEPVSVIPVPKAGGSVAAFAYQKLDHPVVVEYIQAHAGIDIGDTLIGMHLRPVAVPLRSSIKQIGEAHVTMAKTRPKLIGGERAVYELKAESQNQNDDTCDTFTKNNG